MKPHRGCRGARRTVTNNGERSAMLFITPRSRFTPATGPHFLDALSKHSPKVWEFVSELHRRNLNEKSFFSVKISFLHRVRAWCFAWLRLETWFFKMTFENDKEKKRNSFSSRNIWHTWSCEELECGYATGMTIRLLRLKSTSGKKCSADFIVVRPTGQPFSWLWGPSTACLCCSTWSSRHELAPTPQIEVMTWQRVKWRYDVAHQQGHPVVRNCTSEGL